MLQPLHRVAGPWRIPLAAAAVLALGLLALACGGGSEPAAEPTVAAPAVTEPTAAAPAAMAAATTAPEPTPTPTPPPNPAEILAETEANMRKARSFRFDVDHEAGSIYVDSVQAKAVKATGGWNGEQGAQMTIDAYLVSGPNTPTTDGTYVELRMAVTADSYFLTDPLSGVWTKRPLENISIPINELNNIVADFIDATTNAALAGEEEVNGASAYKITGEAPASVMGWLLLFPEEGQQVAVEIWTDVATKILREARIIGPIGEYDDADTVRRVQLTGYNEAVDIETPGPDDYLDLSNIQ